MKLKSILAVATLALSTSMNVQADTSKSMPMTFPGVSPIMSNQIFPKALYVGSEPFNSGLKANERFPGDAIGYRGRKKDGLYAISVYRPEGKGDKYQIWQGATWAHEFNCVEIGTTLNCEYAD